jgi:hypothetical protein
MSSEMNINRDNYEEYFLDFLEGKLEGKQMLQFRQFLLENPGLADELTAASEVRIIPEEHIHLTNKSTLKKDVHPVAGIHEGNIEEKLVALMEGDLDDAGRKGLDEFLRQNPAFRHDLDLYEKTRLQPDQDVCFPDKKKLKKSFPVIYIRYFWIGSTAAALLLLFLGWRFFLQPDGLGTSDPFRIVQEPISAMTAKTTPPVASPPAINSAETMKTRQAKVMKPINSEDVAELVKDALPIPIRIEIKTISMIGSVRASRLCQPFKYPGEAVAFHEPGLPGDEDSRSLLGRVFKNLGFKAKQKGEEVLDVQFVKDDHFTFWDLADIGVQGYNRLADRDVQLNQLKDETGMPVEYTFTESGRVLLSKSVNQP